jgi:hypothetical protein
MSNRTVIFADSYVDGLDQIIKNNKDQIINIINVGTCIFSELIQVVYKNHKEDSPDPSRWPSHIVYAEYDFIKWSTIFDDYGCDLWINYVPDAENSFPLKGFRILPNVPLESQVLPIEWLEKIYG